jgi:glyoxylase-like metal-dependent hydrolase (beta-lactamase superfamily II)
VIKRQDITVVNVGYRSTNFWVVSSGRSRLLVDLGLPGMIGALLANLKRMDVPVEEIRYGLATHYHIDHAGCAQELKRRGMRLIVTPEQVEAIPAMTRWIKPTDNYVEITGDDNLVLPINQSRAFLSGLGISGEIIHTPGHSDDSVSLVLEHGAAFTGDLTVESMIATEDAAVVAGSWQRLRERGVTTIYGGHGPVRTLATDKDRTTSIETR